MTSRSRLLRLFQGQEIDRVPIWLLAPYHQLDYYADIYHIQSYRPVVEAIEAHCDTFDRRRPDMGFCYNVNPDIEKIELRENDFTGTRYQYKDRRFDKGVLRKNGHTTLKYPIEEPEYLEDVLSLPFIPHLPNPDVMRAEKAELGERGLLMMDLGDPLEPLYHICSAENFSMWTLTDLKVMLDFTDSMNERVLALYRRYLEQDIADAYFIVGAEFAGPPLVSPDLFNNLSSRYLKEVVRLIKSYGKIAIIHYHGNLYRVLEGFREVAPSGLHTIEAPPIGDCTISQAREVLGKDTVLIGNVQYDDLEKRTPQEINALVRDVLEEVKSAGRFVLSPTAGPYDPSPSPQLIQNYLAFIKAGIQYGGLGR